MDGSQSGTEIRVAVNERIPDTMTDEDWLCFFEEQRRHHLALAAAYLRMIVAIKQGRRYNQSNGDDG